MPRKRKGDDEAGVRKGIAGSAGVPAPAASSAPAPARKETPMQASGRRSVEASIAMASAMPEMAAELTNLFYSPETEVKDKVAIFKAFAAASLQREQVAAAAGLSRFGHKGGDKTIVNVLNLTAKMTDEEKQKMLLDALHGENPQKVVPAEVRPAEDGAGSS